MAGAPVVRDLAGREMHCWGAEDRVRGLRQRAVSTYESVTWRPRQLLRWQGDAGALFAGEERGIGGQTALRFGLPCVCRWSWSTV